MRTPGIPRLRGAGLGALLLGAAACASLAPPRPPVPRAPRAPTAEDRKADDRKYYEAVDAYMKQDYARARALIGEILAADPGHAAAKSLLVRVKAVEKASAPPAAP